MSKPNPIIADVLTAPGIAHGFFTSEGGVSGDIYTSLNCGLGSKDDADAVTENRNRVARHLGAKAGHVLTVYQIHSDKTLVADGPIERSRLPKADAIVTRTLGLVIGALAADCAPVLLADAKIGIVGAAHAGWRGAIGGILESAIDAMVALGANRRHIHAAVGPCISQSNYEVGPEFEAEFLARAPGNARWFLRPTVGSRPHFDLSGYVADRLRLAGIGEVAQHSPCTFENDARLFSYRRSQRRKEPDYGRQISAIVLS